MNKGFDKFIDHKISVAVALYNGECGGSYSEATILVCSILSGIASILWPGTGIDRKRFIELLVKYCGLNMHTNYISTVMLVQNFERSSDTANKECAKRLREKYLPSINSLVITGDDVDGSEDVLVPECFGIDIKHIREFSYPNLLYREVRSVLFHEYKLGGPVSSWPMTEREANVSYVNWVNEEKQIYFHFPWLTQLCRAAANSLMKLDDNVPLIVPSTWWIDGAL